MTRIKISVVKGFTVEEVFKGEPPDHLPDDFTSPCPAGFCSWAYADIQKDLVDLYFGSDYYAESKVNWVTCTDGLRPVVFRIEKVED
jgi:uncharacterized repeat protein (TIGR04076 family)